jgi:predicted ATP-dependent serine protease
MCPRCFATGTMVARYERVADQLVPESAGTTAYDLARRTQSVITTQAYPDLRFGRDSLLVLVGPPGGGKTTMGLRMAEGFQSSAFAACETGIGPALGETLQRLEIRSPNLRIEEPRSVRSLMELATGKVRSIVIDSVNMTTLQPEDLVGMARGNGIVVIAICQVTKAGLPAGSNRLIHAADVVVWVENMHWKITKSRFQANGEGEVLICA